MVFRELGKEAGDLPAGMEDGPPRTKAALARADFYSLVMRAVRELTDKPAGDIDLQIACRFSSPPPKPTSLRFLIAHMDLSNKLQPFWQGPRNCSSHSVLCKLLGPVGLCQQFFPLHNLISLLHMQRGFCAICLEATSSSAFLLVTVSRNVDVLTCYLQREGTAEMHHTDVIGDKWHGEKHLGW